jgi:SAM-dependent methyltransferase
MAFAMGAELGQSATACNLCGAEVEAAANRRWRKDGFDILACPACGLLFRADLPTEEQLREIYDRAYFCAEARDTHGQGYADYLGEEPNHRANAAARLELVERYTSPGRLVDVGSAAGFFVDEARLRGWAAEGVELAAEMAGYARDRLSLQVHNRPFADVRLQPRSVDAITMWDYIEHSVDPVGDFRRAATILRPGGVLALSTGDAASVAARVFGSRWHLLTPRHHNFFFTRKLLERALRGAGLEVLLSAHLSSLYSLHYLVYKLRTLRDGPLVRRFVERVQRSRAGEWAVPVNLYDIVTVVARSVPR